MLSKLAQFLLNRLPSKSILLKYATLMPFHTAATLMCILLQACHFVANRLPSKSILLKYATLIPFHTAATLMCIKRKYIQL